MHGGGEWGGHGLSNSLKVTSVEWCSPSEPQIGVYLFCAWWCINEAKKVKAYDTPKFNIYTNYYHFRLTERRILNFKSKGKPIITLTTLVSFKVQYPWRKSETSLMNLKWKETEYQTMTMLQHAKYFVHCKNAPQYEPKWNFKIMWSSRYNFLETRSCQETQSLKWQMYKNWLCVCIHVWVGGSACVYVCVHTLSVNMYYQ